MSRLRDHGLILALFGLSVLFTVLTWSDEPTEGAAAADAVVRLVREGHRPPAAVVVLAGQGPADHEFAENAKSQLAGEGFRVSVATGIPADGKNHLDRLTQDGVRADAIVASNQAAGWTFLHELKSTYPAWPLAVVYRPPSGRGSAFLRNIPNILSQIAVIALVAVGVTFVIATGGIDLSVGGVMAFAGVLTTLLIRDVVCGRDEAGRVLVDGVSWYAMAFCGMAAIAACAGIGLTTGTLVTRYKMPPFIVTLGMMWIARGLAFELSDGKSINQLPGSFAWLGRGEMIPGVPNVIALDVALFLAAYVLINRTALGRYILAVGSNLRAATLSGVPTRSTLVFVYTASAVLAGLGGVVLASRLQAGDPKFGGEYELYVITAVVVGGTSLRGGQGRMFGTLLGALLISVVQVGMNLTGVGSYRQMIVLGAVLIAAVWIDQRSK